MTAWPHCRTHHRGQVWEHQRTRTTFSIAFCCTDYANIWLYMDLYSTITSPIQPWTSQILTNPGIYAIGDATCQHMTSEFWTNSSCDFFIGIRIISLKFQCGASFPPPSSFLTAGSHRDLLELRGHMGHDCRQNSSKFNVTIRFQPLKKLEWNLKPGQTYDVPVYWCIL